MPTVGPAAPSPRKFALKKSLSIPPGRFAHLSTKQLDLLRARAKDERRYASGEPLPVEIWMHRLLLQDERRVARAERQVPGVAASVHMNQVEVHTAEGTMTADPLSHRVVVGDDVVLGIDSHRGAVIVRVEPRRTKLSRPEVGRPEAEQIIVANVEVIVVVVSVNSPPLHPRLIDRYVISIREGGMTPVVFVNKIDLGPTEEEQEAIIRYQAAGLTLLTGSAQTGDGSQALDELLKGRSCAFVGHSGVGKSSLVNRLFPSAGREVGDVSATYRRGRHTTTAAQRTTRPDGTVLIDTPGIRSWGFWHLTAESVLESYPELEGLTCRFSDCTHAVEPGCGVIAARDAGVIDENRYRTFIRAWEGVLAQRRTPRR